MNLKFRKRVTRIINDPASRQRLKAIIDEEEEEEKEQDRVVISGTKSYVVKKVNGVSCPPK